MPTPCPQLLLLCPQLQRPRDSWLGKTGLSTAAPSPGADPGTLLKVLVHPHLLSHSSTQPRAFASFTLYNIAFLLEAVAARDFKLSFLGDKLGESAVAGARGRGRSGKDNGLGPGWNRLPVHFLEPGPAAHQAPVSGPRIHCLFKTI